MSTYDDRRMSEPEVSIAEHLLSGPSVDDLDIERNRSLPREMNQDELKPRAGSPVPGVDEWNARGPDGISTSR
ncbi:hypothetical protein ACIO3S_01050 [Nocardioides sp. NPDC087217]|uniref:hypothetical protein n=1 Tax=Nocardioides sp. NPDC087217 TaxID=3364335 RepID=UPI0037F61F31